MHATELYNPVVHVLRLHLVNSVAAALIQSSCQLSACSYIVHVIHVCICMLLCSILLLNSTYIQAEWLTFAPPVYPFRLSAIHITDMLFKYCIGCESTIVALKQEEVI